MRLNQLYFTLKLIYNHAFISDKLVQLQVTKDWCDQWGLVSCCWLLSCHQFTISCSNWFFRFCLCCLVWMFPFWKKYICIWMVWQRRRNFILRIFYKIDSSDFLVQLDGRVKTLHPSIHGGILARRDQKHHMDDLNKHGIG